jgi:hypothetical protein
MSYAALDLTSQHILGSKEQLNVRLAMPKEFQDRELFGRLERPLHQVDHLGLAAVR